MKSTSSFSKVITFSEIFASKGIELFSSTPKKLTLPGDLTEEERRTIAQKHYKQWLKSGSDYVKTYHYHRSEDDMINLAAFDLHQATERFFACTLLTCTNYSPQMPQYRETR
ncbi:hypothetical protein P4S72_14790 [Vibrio sp. PP-XX7]